MNNDKIIKYSVILIVLIILFREILFQNLINYSKVGVRENITLTDKNLIQKINKHIEKKNLSIEEIISLSNELTSEKLSFTFNDVSSNPNIILELGKANCIGYSSLFNSIGNYVIAKQELTDRHEFTHLVGRLDLFGLSIHKLFNSHFLKDHDFNQLIFKQTGEKKFVDPSLRDYLRIEYVTSE